jgi:hypothetical protein
MANKSRILLRKSNRHRNQGPQQSEHLQLPSGSNKHRTIQESETDRLTKPIKMAVEHKFPLPFLPRSVNSAAPSTQTRIPISSPLLQPAHLRRLKDSRK